MKAIEVREGFFTFFQKYRIKSIERVLDPGLLWNLDRIVVKVSFLIIQGCGYRMGQTLNREYVTSALFVSHIYEGWALLDKMGMGRLKQILDCDGTDNFHIQNCEVYLILYTKAVSPSYDPFIHFNSMEQLDGKSSTVMVVRRSCDGLCTTPSKV